MSRRQFRQWKHPIQHRTQRALLDGAGQIGSTALAALQRLLHGARPEGYANKLETVSCEVGAGTVEFLS
jgi:hypothetical protein